MRPTLNLAINGKKRCSRCKTTKLVSDFSKNSSKPDGLYHYCKVCQRAYHKTPEQRNNAKLNMRRYRIERRRDFFSVGWWRERLSGHDFIGVKARSIKEMFDADPHCSYCGFDLRKAPLKSSVDHRVPRSRGGSNEIENLCISCIHCNHFKNAMTELEFRAFLLEYVGRFKSVQELKDALDWAERGTGT